MKIRLIRRVLLALVPVAGAAWLAAQTASTSPPAPEPTNPVPDMVLTPGSASLTPGSSTGGASGSTGSTGQTDIYSIPKSTPVGMPSHVTPLAGGSSGAGRPVKAADCAGDGWRGYAALGFQDQKGCEAWVARHAGASLTPRAGASTTSGATATTPLHMTAPSRQATVRHPVNPARRATPPPEPVMESMPGSSITPLLNPTPAK